MFRKAGFTLIEILIALFIFAILSMLIVGAMNIIFKSQANTENSANRITELQIALILIERDIEQAVDRPILSANNSIEPPLTGTSSSITMTRAGFANPYGEQLRSTMQRVRYSLNKNMLVRESWPVLDQTMQSAPDSRDLLSNVTELSFLYLDPEQSFQIRWPPSIQASGTEIQMPRAVRVTITLGDLGKISQLYIIPVQKIAKPN